MQGLNKRVFDHSIILSNFQKMNKLFSLKWLITADKSPCNLVPVVGARQLLGTRVPRAGWQPCWRWRPQWLKASKCVQKICFVTWMINFL